RQLVAPTDPGAVCGDDEVRSHRPRQMLPARRVPNQGLNRVEQVDDLRVGAAVELVDEEYDRQMGSAREPAEVAGEALHRVLLNLLIGAGALRGTPEEELSDGERSCDQGADRSDVSRDLVGADEDEERERDGEHEQVEEARGTGCGTASRRVAART